MHIKATVLILGLLLALPALAADSLNCRMIDSLDAPTGHNFNHIGYPTYYEYSGTMYWDLAMGDSFMVWLPGSRVMIFLDPYNSSELDTSIDPHSGSEDIMLCEIQDSTFFTGGGYIYIAYYIRQTQ